MVRPDHLPSNSAPNPGLVHLEVEEGQQHSEPMLAAAAAAVESMTGFDRHPVVIEN